MMENSATKFCMAACIFMIILSLSMNIVTIMGVFPTDVPSPVINQSTVNATQKLAGGDIFSFLGLNIATILSTAFLSVAGFALVVAYATRTGSFNLVAVYLFGLVFWGSWFANLSLFNYGGYFNDYPVMQSIYLLITVVMVFIFAGAAIGILGGNE
jgi:hypothetical protein